MTWFYREFSDRSVDSVLEQAQTQLAALSPDECNTAKVEASDQDSGTGVGPVRVGGGDSRSLVVFSSEHNPPSPDVLGATWVSYTWTTENDYAAMYAGLAVAMNSGLAPNGVAIPPVSAYWSRICMSNMSNGNATLTLFWRPLAAA
jgi:hypothetical protein